MAEKLACRVIGEFRTESFGIVVTGGEVKYVSIMKRLMLILLVCFARHCLEAQELPEMYYSDNSRTGKPVAKDPKIVFFKNNYWMYYSIPPNAKQGWGIGIATSNNLTNWKKAGELSPKAAYEQKGICAPGATVKDGQLHLFYQTYGNGKNDAICHAFSDDGLHFTRNKTNPIFSPSGDWTIGRAIDAEVVQFKGRYFLYYATRDTTYKIQMQGVAVTALNSSFDRSEWTNLSTDSAILAPLLAWEKKCVEGASCIVRGKWMYMFYAGAYNNEPQQIGVAKSKDGVRWTRLSDEPFLKNGKNGEWNESESGHPDIFKDKKGKYFLFYQGNNDKGRTWFLSKRPVRWKNGVPVLAED
jgi:predicted GH43/DUF377 family glycosyl hydrolase